MPEESAQVFTHVIATDTPYYLSGPQQAWPPEGSLPAGTKVTLLEEAGSYCRIRSEDGLEAYVSIDSLQALARFELYADRQGEYRWRLQAANNEVIADSGEGYKQKSACEEAIHRVKQQAQTAQVEDQT